jgi:TonB-linked SusC/RagA family outer membrane protein
MIKKLTKCLSYNLFILLFLVFNIPYKGMGQQLKNIIGAVSDGKTGKPIAEVNVKLKRTKAEVSTNAKGKYGIKAKKNDQLIFSSPGYVTKTLTVGDKTTLNLLLIPVSQGLNELMEIGYGTARKKETTGSMEKMKLEELIKSPVGSIDEAMAGRLAGVQVSSSNGQPGRATDIVIRGVNSLTKSSVPLYVIDGTPIENPDLASINPEEIESINVLKDASATAIYGSRGSNGVIIIVTKRGNIGRPIISLNSNVGFQETVKTTEMMSPVEFVKYQLEVNETVAKQTYTTADLDPADPFYAANGTTLNSYQNATGTDWENLIFRNSPIQIHNLAIRGGDTQTRYALSGSMFNQQGIIQNSQAKRYQGRASLDQIISLKARIGATINYSRNYRIGETVTDSGNDYSTYALYRSWAYRPVSGITGQDLKDYDLDPLYTSDVDIRINPLAAANNEYKHLGTRNFLANAYFELDILRDLQFKSTGSIHTIKNRLDIFNNTLTQQGNQANGFDANGSFHHLKTKDLSIENTLTYSKTFSKQHKLTLLGGHSYYKGEHELFGFSVRNIPQEKLGIYALSQGVPYAGESEGLKYSYKSYYGRISYNFKSKYLFNAIFRADESSVFSKGSHWGYSPAAAFAWNMTEEDFMNKLKAISTSKIKVSYGISGNNRIENIGYYAFLDNTYASNSTLSSPVVGISGLENPNLKWESTKQLDFGYDLGLFKNRIGLTFDYYHKTTGFSNSYTNISSVNNSGLEFTLNTENIRSKLFNWTSSFNISFNKNKILELSQGQESLYTKMTNAVNGDPLYISRVGESAGMFYGYTFDGIYQVEDFNQSVLGQYTLKAGLHDNGNLPGSIQPGHIRYKDLNGDGTLNAEDRSIIGRSLPVHTGGFSNNFSYKRFDLNIFFQWMYGNQIYNANRAMFEGNSSSLNVNQYASYVNRWTPENRSNEFYTVGGQGPAGYQSSKYLEDGSYLRLKTVALSYSVPTTALKFLYLTNLKVHASAQNLFTFTKYSGLDPEVSARYSVLTPGFDYSAYPQARTLSIGINATF